MLADPRYYSEDGTILTKDVSSYIGKVRRCLDPNMSIWVHCALHSACVKSIQVEIGELVPSIHIKGSILREIIDANSPFKSWFTRHALYKILLGKDYLDVFRDFIEMAIAYQHGGLVFRPYVTCDCKNMGLRYRGRFCIRSSGEINLISIPKDDATFKTIVERRLSRYLEDPRSFVPQESGDICLEFNGETCGHLICLKQQLLRLFPVFQMHQLAIGGRISERKCHCHALTMYVSPLKIVKLAQVVDAPHY